MDYQAEVDKISIHFQSQFGQLDRATLSLKPSPAEWSIAEVIQHLIQVNQSYKPAFASIRSGQYTTPWHSRLGFLVNAFGRMILKSVSPDRKRKVKTFPIWEPDSAELDTDLLEAFTKEQADLKDFIHFAKGAKRLDLPISSPANQNILYRLDQAFEIIITHQQRHLEQAMEIHQRILAHS